MIKCERGNNRVFTVYEKTMCSRDIVQKLTNLNLNAPDGAMVTAGASSHVQQGTNLCVSSAIISALRHEMKRVVGDKNSKEINVDSDGQMDHFFICIPKDKKIDEVLEAEHFEWVNCENNEPIFHPNGASFERMLAVLLGCVSLPALSAGGQILFTYSYFYSKVSFTFLQKAGTV